MGLTLAVGAPWVFLLWSYSVICGFWAIARVRTWSEHVALTDEAWPAYRFRPGLLGRFLFFHHNGWCHYEHHLYPQIPYYNLPALRALDKNAKIITAAELFWKYKQYTGGEPPMARSETPAAA